MKIVRFESAGVARYGILNGESVEALAGTPYESITPTGEVFPLEDVRLLAPAEPTKILAVGFNYRDHAKELGREIPTEPNIFMKPLSCLTAPLSPIRIPRCLTHRVEYEAELVAVIGKPARHVSREEALHYVLGFTCGNDVSARDLQTKTNQWTVCKGFDTFGPLGPCIETELSGADCPIMTRVNGETRQNSNTKHLIFDVPYLVSYLSDCMTLLPGDLIFTGTPFGVSPIFPGDVVEVEIGGIGVLQNPVLDEE